MKNAIVGIDQTGAVTKNGKPKPLAATVLWKEQNRLKLDVLDLPALTQKTLETALQHFQLRVVDTLIVADCVFGLPAAFCGTVKDARTALRKTNSELGFGRSAASRFFSQLAIMSKIDVRPPPKRHIETRLNSNSVFQTHPFQKNIQTGTYRLWKELAADDSWFSLLPFETSDHQKAWICEGYPTFYWQKLLLTQTRQPKNLPKLIRKHFPTVEISKRLQAKAAEDANLADATVLSLAGHFFSKGGQKPYQNWEPPVSLLEGWILGVPF
jgi:hypothetical protein